MVWPLFSLLGLGFAATGCTDQRTDLKAFTTKCFERDRRAPVVEDDETLYSDGHNNVIVDDSLTPQAGKYFLDILPQVQNDILDYYQIDSPFRNQMDVYLLGVDKMHRCHSGRVAGCVNSLGASVFFTPEKFQRLNHIVQNNLMVFENKFAMEMSNFIHEVSHAVRFPLVPWWGLEEGLATDSEEFFAWSSEARRFRSGIGEPAHRIFEGPIQTGETIAFEEHNHYYPGLSLLSIDKHFAKVVLPSLSPEIPRKTIKVPLNSYFSSNNLIFYFDRSQSPAIFLKVYSLLVPISSPPPVWEGWVEVKQERNLICHDSGKEDRRVVLTDDGMIEASTNVEPYARLPNFEYSQIDKDLIAQYYDTGMHFWKCLRQDYGEETVPYLLQSMIEFAQRHQEEPAYFPFFQTFMDVTGLDETEAREYFDRFSVPVDDKWYSIGGICW